MHGSFRKRADLAAFVFHDVEKIGKLRVTPGSKLQAGGCGSLNRQGKLGRKWLWSNLLEAVPADAAEKLNSAAPSGGALLNVSGIPGAGTHEGVLARLQALVIERIEVTLLLEAMSPASLEDLVIFPRPSQTASAHPLAVNVLGQELVERIAEVVPFANVSSARIDEEMLGGPPTPTGLRDREAAFAAGI